MIKKRLNDLKKKFETLGIDGYIVPKNDEFFSEYTNKDRLKTISNFSGSAGYAIILKNINYLFVDGRYTIQAKIESGKNFKIISHNKIVNCDLFKNLKLGIDPKIFTSHQIKVFFKKFNKIKIINENLIDDIFNKYKTKSKFFFSIRDDIIGEGYKKKIYKISKLLKKQKLKYLFVSAPENVAWLLNIRGYDNPNSPIPNCRLLITNEEEIYLITKKIKTNKLLKEKKINNSQIIEPKKIFDFFNNLKTGKILIDKKTCSIFYENFLKKKFKVVKKDDPIYFFKSLKNITEINHMKNSHIFDGVALTKFLYWIKEKNKKKINEFQAQKKLEKFRKMNKNFLYPSFDTIAGSGKNGAIIHYRANKKNCKIIRKKDIFLCDSGGQYKYGTTDVTRTICFSKPKRSIKKIFTKVLKGHIAVAQTNLKTHYNGKMIDVRARKFLKKDKLDYEHGTGHGVGFYLNVHEGPQSISRFNKVKIREGMILSNEPGFYKKGQFGIRIENLLYVKKEGRNLVFKNLTLAPIEKDLINFKQLDNNEIIYLFKYHLNVYAKLSKYLNKKEKKWLASFI